MKNHPAVSEPDFDMGPLSWPGPAILPASRIGGVAEAGRAGPGAGDHIVRPNTNGEDG
jgi:hypothetical protein